jgi:anti-sigma factor RsiW
MTHPDTERLSEYLDDTLGPAGRVDLEAHLAACAACSVTLDELRAVVRQAGQLGPIEPATDLWQGIEARIGAAAAPAGTGGARAGEPVPSSPVPPVAATAPVPIDAQPRWYATVVRMTVPQMAAAGLLIAALSGGAAWSLLRAPSDGTGSRSVAALDGAPVDAATANSDAFPGDQGYQTTIADLEQTLDRGEGRLDPATLRVLRSNLAIIDAAITDSRRALSADPESPYLYRHLNQQMQRKVDLLQQATVYAYAGN